jgi:hypothetical protein
MSHSWVCSVDDDFLRADDIRQINIASELRVVFADGRQFLIAQIEDRATRLLVAEELAFAMAEADAWTQAAAIYVVDGADGWTVEIRPMRNGTARQAAPLTAPEY